MVAGVVNQAIIGKNNALGVAIALHIIDVAFCPCAPIFLGQQPLVIAIAVAADGFARSNLVQGTLGLPAQLFCLVFGDVVVGQLGKFVDIGSHMLFIRIGCAFTNLQLTAVSLHIGSRISVVSIFRSQLLTNSSH